MSNRGGWSFVTLVGLALRASMDLVSKVIATVAWLLVPPLCPSFMLPDHSSTPPPPGRKTLVLDLDETLIHSKHQPFPGCSQCDLKVQIQIDHTPCTFYINQRPHALLFLDTVAQWYNLVVFTASLQPYGDPVIEHLDRGKGLFSQRLFRESCRYDPSKGAFMKDLTQIEPDLRKVMILDNSPGAYELQPANAIPIDSWIDNPFDESLLDLLPFLDALRYTDDVRSVLSLRRQK